MATSILNDFRSILPENSAGAVATVILTFVFTSIAVNVFQQLYLQRKNEPPVVFHWLPVIGSTVTYGIDPFKFFFDCQAKVFLDIFDSLSF